MEAKKTDNGLLRIDADECKGCGLCIEACPLHVIRMGGHLNHYGYKTAEYLGAGCSGCGICFLACPEPGAIAVYKLDRALAAQRATGAQGAASCASN